MWVQFISIIILVKIADGYWSKVVMFHSNELPANTTENAFMQNGAYIFVKLKLLRNF